MNNFDLKSEILELIDRNTEGVYWDFKQQWHSNNADLLHDVICMANSPANRDCYVIIGIQDKTNEILGVDTVNRKNQQQIIDLIRQKPKWAGGHIPEVYVMTISISDKEIDVLIIKQSDNTPFYLLDDYKGEGNPIFKGSIYTRKGDTNTPKNSTADLYDTEILWKRHFGLLYNPSQRAKHYLIDLENWERIDGELDKLRIKRFFFYYKPDPDYTIHFVDDSDISENKINSKPKDINDNSIGSLFYYLFAFCNVSYHTDISYNEKIVLYYRDIPLFSNTIECIDEGRTRIVPPEFGTNSFFIKDSFRYLIFEFVFTHWCGNYSREAKMMLMRVIPLYKNEREYNDFINYIKNSGFSRSNFLRKQMSDEALSHFNNTIVKNYEFYGDPSAIHYISETLKNDTNLVINFAHPNNNDFDEITKQLRLGKMLVDWLDVWRKNSS